jgi:uncharacterized protein
LIRHAIAAVAACLALPVLAQAPAPAATAPATKVPAARQYLWEVASLTNRIYLYGTVHAGKPSFFPLPEVVDKAFLESKVIAVEADITDVESMTRSARSMVYEPPATLEKDVPKATWARIQKQAARLGFPEPQIAMLKPFMAGTLLAFAEWGRLGYLPQFGVDLHLIKRAKDSGKRLVELEGGDAQTAVIESLTLAESLASLEGTLNALESGLVREQITGMVNAWQAGDPALLLEVARAYNESIPGAAVIEEKFIWSRHDAMVEKISRMLTDSKERHFVAVGALHMAGPKGLVELLKKRGFMVRQL